MFTITPRTRIREGISWEDDRCTTGYEIINSDGEIIYDFADEDTKNWYEELNKKEEKNTMKTTFKTIEQNINKLRRDYGEMIFRMSILARGIQTAFKEGHCSSYHWLAPDGHGFGEWSLNTAQIDSEVADIIIQLAVWGEVVYG